VRRNREEKWTQRKRKDEREKKKADRRKGE
jgi:hypothetical protein